MGRPATGKRQKLLAAAMEQFHRNGYAKTSLADVAKAAGIAAGNVFYYFRAKDDLAKAAVDEWSALLSQYLAALEVESDPWRRLERFLEQAEALVEMYVAMGCPLAGLTRDLRKETDTLKLDAARIYSVQFSWLEKQLGFAGMSRGDAEKVSRFLMSGYHGAITLAYAQNDPSLITCEVEGLKTWLRDVRQHTPHNS